MTILPNNDDDSETEAAEPPRLDLRAALREADWETLLPNLITYAANRLRRVGWAAGQTLEPSKMSVEQIVNMSIEACLDGSRSWNSNAVDLPGFLRGVIRSLTSSEKKKAVRAKTDPRADCDLDPKRHLIDPSLAPSAEEEMVAEESRAEILQLIEACTDDDEDLRAIFHTIIDDGLTKREDIAEALGWTVDRVTAARIKLQRRIMRQSHQSPTTFAPTRTRRRRAASSP